MPDLLWIHYTRPRTAWYELTEADREALSAGWVEVRRASTNAGGQQLGEFNVRGQSDYSTAEVWLFPSAEDAFDHWARLTHAGYAEWFVAQNNVGLRKAGSA
jgi:hypothetical protein